MDCWEVLGITPRSDKKTIKIAYAKLLKQTRPDEDPEGFQRLHAAYKEAQSWEDYYYDDEPEFDTDTASDQFVDPFEAGNQQANELENSHEALVLTENVTHSEVALPPLNTTAEESLPKELVESTLHSPNNEVYIEQPVKVLSDEELALLEDIREQEKILSDSWEVFREKVNNLVLDSKACNKVENWNFLSTMPAMKDLEFRKNAGDSLFEVVSELNEEALKKKSLYIKRPVINHLNQLFQWDKLWQEYEYRYSESLLEGVFPYLEETEKVVKGTRNTREVHYYRRIGAFAIDSAIGAAIAMAIYAVGNHFSPADDSYGVLWVMCWVLFYTLIIIPFQECSTHQATFGKRILSLKVIDNRGDRLNFFHAFGRSFVTLLCCGLFKFVLWINLILSWWKNELLQDSLSRSYVIKKGGWD
jgi:uncharacterized RDD family membrane protein YckC